MYAWSASRCLMRTSSASTTSTGDSARASNARESSATPAQTGSTVLIDRRGGPRHGPPDPSSERGYAPLGLPRPSLGRAPAQPWRASDSSQDGSSIVVGGLEMAPQILQAKGATPPSDSPGHRSDAPRRSRGAPRA